MGSREDREDYMRRQEEDHDLLRMRDPNYGHGRMDQKGQPHSIAQPSVDVPRYWDDPAVMNYKAIAWNIIPRVMYWFRVVFGKDNLVAHDPIERALRFLEEAQELAQAVGVSRHQAEQLVAYTWSRPKGEVGQEVGGVGITLANLCGVLGLDFMMLTEQELERIQLPEVMEKIRSKQVSKQLHGIGGAPVQEPIKDQHDFDPPWQV